MAECKEKSREDNKAERGSSRKCGAEGSSAVCVAGGTSPIKWRWSKWMKMRFEKLS